MRELLLKIGSAMENGDIVPGDMSSIAFLKLKFEIQNALYEVNYGPKREREKPKEPDEPWEHA